MVKSICSLGDLMITIDLRGLRKSFDSNVVLKDINLQLEAGKFYALLGQNGAGKSTLMRVLMRYESFDNGSGQVLNVALDSDDALLNSQIGFVTETLEFNLNVSIAELFRLHARLYPNWSQDIFVSNLNEMRLDTGKVFGSLSRGQKMQVAFAAALAIRPKILLLDEISSVLDAHARSHFMKKLKAYAQAGGTVLLATNMVSEVHEIADQLILIDNGVIYMNTALDEIASRFRKVRRLASVEHPLFTHKDCVEIGVNSDQSVSYIAPVELIDRQQVPGEWVDKRAITAFDVFVYYTGTKRAA